MTTATPVLDTLTEITTASIEHSHLGPRETMLARIAALVAVAPVVGTAKIVSASGNLMRALGFAIAATEEDIEG